LGLFVIYRAVMIELGVSMLGVWSLVLATTAFGRLADVGISAGLARFVARALETGGEAEAAVYTQTAFVSMAAIMAVVAVVGWAPLSVALGFALEGEELAIARALLPWALATFWMLNLNAVAAAALLGMHRSDLRSIANIAGMALQIAVSLLLITHWRLLGLAWAQAAQYVLAVTIAGAFLYRGRLLGGAPAFSWPAFRELIGFGSRLQLGTIANLLFEPASKIVLGHVAGTATLGVFEAAYRMVYQARNIAVMALQNLVPAFTSLQARSTAELTALFRKSSRIAALGGGGLMAAAVIASPLVSIVWLGQFNADFVQLTALIAVCWVVNIVAAPAYFLGLATGRIGANVGGQILTAAISPLSGYVLGHAFGGIGAIVGILAGKVAGDVLPAVFNRPTADWRDAAIANPFNIAATAVVTAVAAILIAIYRG